MPGARSSSARARRADVLAVTTTATAELTVASVDALALWLGGLRGCPPVTRTVVVDCPTHPAEAGDAAWFVVRADPRDGLAEHRCLACGDARWLLGRLGYPDPWGCTGCGGSQLELVAGLSCSGSGDSETVGWVVLAGRCVGCGAVAGLADATVPGLPLAEVLARL